MIDREFQSVYELFERRQRPELVPIAHEVAWLTPKCHAEIVLRSKSDPKVMLENIVTVQERTALTAHIAKRHSLFD